MERQEDLYRWLLGVIIPFSTGKMGLQGQYYPVVEDDLYQLGPLRLKQIRHPPDSCVLPSVMEDVIHDCNGESKMLKEDKDDYDVGWTKYTVKANLTQTDQYFIHRSAQELNSVPTSAAFDVYSGWRCTTSLAK